MPQDTTADNTDESIELSVVMPCLNEADTLETCIKKAQTAIREHDIRAEIIISDNGSTDGSIEIARNNNCRVINAVNRGYGSALMAGIAAARGRFVIMGDADDSYDFLEIPAFLKRLREGNDLVQGCRLSSGGGTILPGAMPFLHRWFGNPALSALARLMFGTPVHDVYCGLRGFTKELYGRLDQRCTGMEFATEMVIKSKLMGAGTAQVPITLHPDGRKQHAPHLRTFRDGWRTLKLFMVYSPRWTFFIPGLALVLIGLIGYALAMPAFQISGATLDAHTLLFASLSIIMGYQAVLFAVLARAFAVRDGLLPKTGEDSDWVSRISPERSIACGCVIFLSGVALLVSAVYEWWRVDFGHLEYARTMRRVIPGVLLASLGFQNVLAGFFLSVLQLKSSSRTSPGVSEP